MPLTVTYARLGVNPELLTGTDLRGDALPGLRKPTSWSANYALTIRRSRPGGSWLTKGLLDPLTFNGSYTRGRCADRAVRCALEDLRALPSTISC